MRRPARLRDKVTLANPFRPPRWSPGLEQEVLAVGAVACLKKPVDPGALRQAVRDALRLEERRLGEQDPDRN